MAMEYWPASRSLTVQTLIGWALVSYVTPLFAEWTNEVQILGFPLGYWIGSQGILVFYVIWLFVFVMRQDRIDIACGGGDSDEGQGHVAGFGSDMRQLIKVFLVYTGGFFLFVCFLGVLEAAGIGETAIGYLYMICTLGLYAAIGILMHTHDQSEYFVAGENVPAIFNGMATAADWMSGASFVAMAGGLYSKGYDYLAFIIGWTGGYILVATLVAPYLRRYECYTVASFVRGRYQGELKFGNKTVDLSVFAGMGAIIVSVCCSFTYLVAQVYSSGMIMSYFTGLQVEVACFIGLAGVLLCSMLGGMKAVTWTQVAQYIILIVAYILPCVLMSVRVDDGYNKNNPIAQISYGGAIQEIKRRGQELIQLGLASESDVVYTDPKQERQHFLFLSIVLMCGTASLPHVLMRYFTTKSVKGARKSVAWSLLFIFFLYVTAPAYAAFAKLEVYENVIGKSLIDLPKWIYKYGAVKLTKVCGEAVTTAQDAALACNADTDYVLKVADLQLKSDAVVICTPEIADLPYTIGGLVAAGGLAAALSTADGLLLAITNACAHDIYGKIIDRNASPTRLLIVSRALLLIVAAAAALVAIQEVSDILGLVAWAFSMAASGNFPAIVLGIWWNRANVYGCLAGQICGFGITLIYLIGSKYAGWDWGVQNIASGIFGIPVGFAMNIIVSLMTPPPSAETKAMVTRMREGNHRKEVAETQADGSHEEPPTLLGVEGDELQGKGSAEL